jgi:uncharacterized protein (DUF1810 family)
MDDPFAMRRFTEAQEPVYDQVLAELRAGQKRSHWMWFIFPQIAGLGSSPTSRHFAISGRDEAAAYLSHPVLGARLKECVGLLLRLTGRSAHAIFGSPDDMKLRSCLTLFAAVAPEEPVFGKALEHYFGGQPDPATLERL